MYIPASFAATDVAALHALMRRESFATLVTVAEDLPVASHIPFLLDRERGPSGTLLGHLARANPQWRGFATERDVLVIFQGPHAYISPRWYAGEANVPTWNYAVVHAYGRPRLLDDPGPVLERLVDVYEQGAAPWRITHAPGEYIAALQQAIVAFEIPIARLEGKFKMSQNKSDADRRGAIAGLRARGAPTDLAVADIMEDTLA